MSLLAPLFLAALAAIAVPVIIHLSHRERKDVVPFPSLMFLEQVPFRVVRRQRLRHWFLFLLRALALALLAVAFARPFFDRDIGPTGATTGAREVVVLLDRSYSMGYGDRWQQARTAAHDVIRSMTPEDRITLVTFDERAIQPIESGSDPAPFHATIDRTTLGASGTRFGPALQLAQKILDESTRPRLALMVISDFQRVGWDGHDEVQLPEGTDVRWINVADDEPSNLAVAGLVLNRQLDEGRERVRAVARVTYQGTEPWAGAEVRLEVAGQVVASERVDIDPNGAATVTFPPFALGQGATTGTVTVSGDRLAADDAFYFGLERGQTVPVLILQHPNAGPRQSLFLRRALEIGQRPPFSVSVRSAGGGLTARDLPAGGVVIMNDAPWPGGDAGRALAQFVRDGGGLVLVAGPRTQASGWGASGGLITARFGEPIDRSADRGASLSYLDYSHPILDVFSAPRSGDFASTRFYRYRPLRTDSTALPLARFDDGSVALATWSAESGRVVAWSSSIDDSWSDLPLQPVYLPFVHQMAKHAAGYVQPSAWLRLGDVFDVADAARRLQDDGETLVNMVVEQPWGDRRLIDLAADPSLFELEQPGIYTVRPAEDASRGLTFAANVDIAESNLAVVAPQEIASAITGTGTIRPETVAEGGLTREDRERRQGLWWYLIIAVLLLFTAETLIANRLAPVAR